MTDVSMSVKMQVLAVIFVGVLISGCSSHLSNPGTSGTSAKDGKGDTITHISNILGTFTNDFDINDLKALVENFKLAGSILKDAMKVSPILKSIVNDAAKKNIKIKILEEVLQGKIPTVGDLFKLATTKTNNTENDLVNSFKTNPHFQMFKSLTRGNVLKKGTIAQFVELITGKKIEINPSNRNTNNKYVVKSQSDLAFDNVMNLAYFIWINRYQLKTIRHIIGENPLSYDAILEQIKKMDFARVLASPLMPNNTKYTVDQANGHQIGDPTLPKLLQDLRNQYTQIQTAPKSSVNAEETVLNIVGTAMKIFDSILMSVGAGGNTSVKT